jgi:hypothetical protein
MEEFSSTLQAIGEFTIDTKLPLLPVFQVIQHFKSLPDFLMFPVFLALRHQYHFTSALEQGLFPPDIEIIHNMMAFVSFANETRERSQLTSDALKYACQNWAFHLSRAPERNNDDNLNHTFKSFWKDLRSCLIILSEGEKLAKVCFQYCDIRGSEEESDLCFRNLVAEGGWVNDHRF